MGPRHPVVGRPRADPPELDQWLTQLRATNPATAQRTRLERDLARTTTAIGRLLEADQEQLLNFDELRARMPELRKRETTVRAQLAALDAQLVDHPTYLKPRENLDSFLTRLRKSIDRADDGDRQRVLRAVVREILVGPDGITIHHSIPPPSPSTSPSPPPTGAAMAVATAAVGSAATAAEAATTTVGASRTAAVRPARARIASCVGGLMTLLLANGATQEPPTPTRAARYYV